MVEKRVLIVDDTAFMRTMLRNVLESIGVSAIFEGLNGIDAVRLYKTMLPDLVLLDITMPDKDGMEALEEIITFDPYARVVMVSSRSYPHLVARSYKIGALDFIAKPFQSDFLMETICKYLQAVPRL